MTIQPPAKKPNIQPPTKAPVRVPILNTYRPGPAHSKTGQPAKKNDEIVCTPDILGLFNDNEETAIPSINMMPSTSLAPPPLVMRNNQRPPRPTVPTATPIYVSLNKFFAAISGFNLKFFCSAQRQRFPDRFESRSASGNLPIAQRKVDSGSKTIGTAESIRFVPSRDAGCANASRAAIYDSPSKSIECQNLSRTNRAASATAFQFSATNAVHFR